MKHLLRSALLFIAILSAQHLIAQNVMINVLTQNSGIVKKNEIIFFEVTISNTSATTSVPAYKLKPQISFPGNIVIVPTSGHKLPSGWTILSNNNGVVVLSNGTDIIPENQSRTILISVKGTNAGGPSSIVANLGFSNGTAPGNAAGSTTAGDNIADNASSSTIKVIN
ncbi:MAG: hypothetical protein QM687_16105 [Ferruginibacter sp.]